MRILITGVSGQVGGALVVRLAQYGEIIPASRAALDLSEPATIRDALDRIQPNLVINPAAYSVVDKAEEERDLAFKINGEAVGALGQWARDQEIPLIHFSTDYVFDGAGDAPFAEDVPVSPLSAYGASKAEGERLLKAAAPDFLIIRTSWVYAAQGKNFLRTIARLAGEREELRIVSDQFGSPTSANQIANCVARILDHRRSCLKELFESAHNILHFSANGVTTWHGFACAIVDGLRRRGIPLQAKSVMPISTAEYPTPARRPQNSRLDTSRVRQLLGMEIASWQAALDTELDLLAEELRKS
ncbi:MAG: dTDP-4-dehydrorhamnose reductase [Rhodomicrobium sp.]